VSVRPWLWGGNWETSANRNELASADQKKSGTHERDSRQIKKGLKRQVVSKWA